MVTQCGAAHTRALSGGTTGATTATVSGGVGPRLASLTAVLTGGAVVPRGAILTAALPRLILVGPRGTHGTEL